MSLFKKASKASPKSSECTISYPVDIVFWDAHYEALSKLFNDAEIDLNSMRVSGYMKAKLVPEPDNERDPNAIQVFAAAKGRNKTFYPIGYISSEENVEIRPDIKKVVAGSHYWSIRYYFDLRSGLDLSLNLYESKFAK